MRILQRNLKRTTDTFLFISHTTNVLLFKFRCNIFFGVRIIKEMPGSVASGTRCTNLSLLDLTIRTQQFNLRTVNLVPDRPLQFFQLLNKLIVLSARYTQHMHYWSVCPKRSSTLPAAPHRFRARCRAKRDTLGGCAWGLHPDLATILLFQNSCKGGQGPKREEEEVKRKKKKRRSSGLPYPSSLHGKNFENHKISRTGQQVSGQQSEPRNCCDEELLTVTCHVCCPVAGRTDAGSQHFRNVSQGQGARVLGYLNILAQGALTVRVSASLLAFIPLREVTASSELQALM